MTKLVAWIVAGIIVAAPVTRAKQGDVDEARIKKIVDGIVQPARLEMRGIEHCTTKDFLNWIWHWDAPDKLPAPYNHSNFSIGLVGYLVSDATGQRRVAKP